MSFRNERKLYKRKCDATHRDIISIYHQEKSLSIYNPKIRWSDTVDNKIHGVDNSSNFISIFSALQKSVPRVSVFNDNQTESENCEYTNDFNYGKNCYLVFSSWNIQNSAYCS